LALAGGHLPRIIKALTYIELLTSLLILALGLLTVAGVAGRFR
jgi:hypothetical protein